MSKKIKVLDKKINYTSEFDYGNVAVYATLQCDLATMRQSVRLDIEYSKREYENITINNISIRKVLRYTNCLDFLEDTWGFVFDDISNIVAATKKVVSDKSNVEMVRETATATDIYSCIKEFIYENENNSIVRDNGEEIKNVYIRGEYGFMTSSAMSEFVKSEGINLNCKQKDILAALKNKEVLIPGANRKYDTVASQNGIKVRCYKIKL